VQVSCHGVTSSGLPAPDIDQPFGETPLGSSSAGEEAFPRGQRVLDGLSGVRAKGWIEVQSNVSDTDPFEIFMSNAAMIP
jgi:hypothetical protein